MPGPPDAPQSSVLSPRAAAARAGAVVLLALVAGACLFLIEAAHLLVVLSPSFDGPGERLRFTVLLLPTLLGVGLLGLGLGVFSVACEALRQGIALALGRHVPGLSPATRELASLGVAAAVVTLPILRGTRGIQDALNNALGSYNTYVAPIPFVVAHERALYRLAAFLVVLFLAAVHRAVFSAGRPLAGGRPARALAAVAALASVAVVAASYVYDTGSEFGRNEAKIHFPLLAGYTLVAVLGVGFGARAATSMEWASLRSRRVVTLALGLAAAGVLSFVFAFFGMRGNRNVEALLWTRSAIARRCYEAARWAVDRDGDGFSPIFGGGDLDDGNPRVNPLAPEIPGNGVDDNCIGGDLPLSALARAPKRPAPGELAPVHGPEAAWSPRYTPPPGAVDVEAVDAPRAAGPSEDARLSVILIGIDTLRADHTNILGYGRATTPNLARYAARGLSFTRAFSQGTNTGHSFGSLLRSAYGDAIFDRNIPTLTQLFKQAGYHTSSVNSRRLDGWLRQRVWHPYRPTMIEDFDVMHLEGGLSWTAADLTDHMLGYLDRLPAGRPEFLWIHYNDAHFPRIPHPEYGFGDRSVDGYDAAVAFTDAHVGRLLDHMDRTGVLARSVVFIFADHGEGFFEHGVEDHGNKPYIEAIHVPLVVLAPGLAPAVLATPVALIDVAPTALSLAGLPVPYVYRGANLAAPLPARVIVSETPRNTHGVPFLAWSYLDWPYAYLHDARAGTDELFDLEADPGEHKNLVERQPDQAARMGQAFGEWLDLETSQRPRRR
jgi:choline-sulfatase